MARMDADHLRHVVTAVRVFADVVPLKKKIDVLETRLNKISFQLEDLHKNNTIHEQLNFQWQAHHDEIFGAKIDKRQKQIELQELFLGRMASPKRQVCPISDLLRKISDQSTTNSARDQKFARMGSV